MMTFSLELTDSEMEALQSLCCTADLSRMTEASMPGLARLLAKIYQYEPLSGRQYQKS